MSFDLLPNELLLMIFGNLNGIEVNEAAETCQRWWILLRSRRSKVVLLDECILSEDSPVAQIFREPLGVYTALRVGTIRGFNFGKLTETVTKLEIGHHSNLHYDLALLKYFPRVKDFSITYSADVREGVFENVETVRVHMLQGEAETFINFMAGFPNVKRIYIESVYYLMDDLMKYLLPFKNLIRALPRDTIKFGTDSMYAFQDLDQYSSSRNRADWRLTQDELIGNGLHLERPAFTMRDKAELANHQWTYYKNVSEINLVLKEPFNVFGMKPKSVKVHLNNELLACFPTLLQCESLEVVAFSSGLPHHCNISPCFFGHYPVPCTVKNLIIRLGTRKDCERCWKALFNSCSLYTLYVHAIARTYIFEGLAGQQQLRSLMFELSPPINKSDKPVKFTWTPFPKLHELRMRFTDQIDLPHLAQILDAQPQLKTLDLRGNGDFRGIIESILKIHELRFLTIYILENLLEMERLTACKKLKQLCLDDIVTNSHGSDERMDPSVLFENCPLFQRLKNSFRRCATRVWRRLGYRD